MDDNIFEELEKLNIDIDICIDQEEYKKVYSFLIPEDTDALKACFTSNTLNTHDDDDKWIELLDISVNLPIKEANGISLKNNPIDIYWSRLLYSKLIRAHIQARGSDCYLRRLDDLIVYLEKSLPPMSSVDGQEVKLLLFYLFELSNSAIGYEILGFANRAQRILRHQDRQELVRNDFSWFYGLLARYNCGVSYFHAGRYRQAIMEFNYIIRTITETNSPIDNNAESKKNYYDKNNGYLFLFLPAVLYRADVQIKLQLAYHSLDTLQKYFADDDLEVSLHKKVRAELIRADANQLMYNVGAGWQHLEKASNYIGEIIGLNVKLGSRIEFNELSSQFSTRQIRNVKSRFVDIFIENQFTWLDHTYGPETNTSPNSANTHLNAHLCISTLKSTFSEIDYEIAKFNVFNRRGYYLQLSHLLSWLTRKYEILDNGKLLESKDGDIQSDFYNIAEEIYLENHGRLMQEKSEMDKQKCLDCDWRGIDIERLNAEHHKWFTEYMFDFYDSVEKYFRDYIGPFIEEKYKNIKKILSQKNRLIKRLIAIERKEGEDRRITDLNLRYKRYTPDPNADQWFTVDDGSNYCIGESQQNPPNWQDAFYNLLKCVPRQDTNELTDSNQYEQIMGKWRKHFARHLQYESVHQHHEEGVHFISLQRWNSSSPAQGRSIGGGYLLYKTDKYGKVDLGIAIDPGFDFLRNLFRMGFSLNDIDIILVSHAHADHIRDFESIAILLYELKKRVGKRKKIHAILTLGAYKRLEHIIEDSTFRFSIEPYIIDVYKEIDSDYFENLDKYQFNFNREEYDNAHPQIARYQPTLDMADGNGNYPKITICPSRAYHNDSSPYSDSFGFLISIKLNENDNVTLGYTGDTKWVYPEIADPLSEGRVIKAISEQYKDCEAIVLHLGSLIDDKKSFSKYIGVECESIVQDKNHPYLIGALRFLTEIYSNNATNGYRQLVLLGEFGEELRGGIRKDLIIRLKKAYGSKLAFLPLDVGMDIQLQPKQYKIGEIDSKSQNVWCVQCEGFVDIEEADFQCYGVDEALYCICATCVKATPLNVLQDKFRDLYEVGYELRTHETS